MHNIAKYDITLHDELSLARMGLHATKRAHFDELRDKYEKVFAAYDDKAQDGILHELTPLWVQYEADEETEKVEKKRMSENSYNLYSSGMKYVRTHIRKLKEINGGDAIICPLCGIKLYNDVDHYVPRELMPEYAVHLSNLIPLCHDCNINKHTGWLNDEGTSRLFFNAFYDAMPVVDILTCEILLDDVSQYPMVRVDINTAQLDETRYPDNIVLSTLNKLHLIDVYQYETKQLLKKEIQNLIDHYEERHSINAEVCRRDVVKEQKSVCLRHLNAANTYTFLEKIFFRAFGQSEVIEDWFANIQ